MKLHCQLRDKEKRKRRKKNQQAERAGKTRISGQQHPRSVVGRQTVMLKFRSHTLLQTMLSLGRRRMTDSGGGKNKKRGGREGDRHRACIAQILLCNKEKNKDGS